MGVKRKAPASNETSRPPNKKHRSWQPYKSMPITVVDKHNDALLPIWKASNENRLPASKLKMIHFDSHPDLGVLPFDDHLIKRTALVPGIYQNKFDEAITHSATEIGSWILIPVLQGLVDEVYWMRGWWSEQIPPGSYNLVVGRCSETGRMKVGCPGDKQPACMEYWYASDSVCAMADFEFYRPWKLHVYRFNKGGILTPAQLKRLTTSMEGHKWILDMDLDFFSTNNPTQVEFASHFGSDSYKFLAGMFDAELNGNFVEDREDLYEYWAALEATVLQELFHKSPQKFLQDQSVKSVIEYLTKAGSSKKECVDAMRKWRKLCLDVFPANATETSVEWNTRDIYSNEHIVEIARNSCVPHHITTLPEILKMINCCDRLFTQIGTRPLLCTVATSRADRYLPDEQACAITTLGLRMLRRQYGPDCNVERADQAENTAPEDPERFPKPALPVRSPRTLKTRVFSPRKSRKR